MIKGIVIGAVVMYLLGAVEGLNEYLYLPLEWIVEGLEAVTAENLQGSGFDSPQVHHSLKF